MVLVPANSLGPYRWIIEKRARVCYPQSIQRATPTNIPALVREPSCQARPLRSVIRADITAHNTVSFWHTTRQHLSRHLSIVLAHNPAASQPASQPCSGTRRSTNVARSSTILANVAADIAAHRSYEAHDITAQRLAGSRLASDAQIVSARPWRTPGPLSLAAWASSIITVVSPCEVRLV